MNNYIEYESKGDKDQILPIKEYLDITDNHKTEGEWKI